MRTIRLLTTVACLAPWALPASANDEVQKLIQDPNQWAIQTGDYANTRYSKLDQINAGNVGKLQAAWTFSTGVLRGHEGAPLVVGDVMYVHTPFPNIVYALDLNNDGKIIWKYEPKQDPTVIPVMCCDTVHRGVAYADGKIFLHQADTTLVALDAKTGKVVWSKVNGDPKKGETNTATVLPVKDKIIVGISGGEFGVRCHVTAYDMKDGRQVWRAYSMGPDNEMLIDPDKTMEHGKPVGKDSSIKTWQGEQWKTGGGCTWGWYSYDPAQNAFYYGSGNPSTWNPKQRPGDNKWTMTIFSRDVDTGVAKWVYQMTPHDEWDYDGVNEMILADQDVKGQRRPILVHFDRNGFGYTLDRVTGELLVAEKYDPTVNWASKVDMDKASKTYGRPLVVSQFSTEQNGEDVNSKGICPAALGYEGSAAGGLLAEDRAVLRADEPRLHGLRAVPGPLHAGTALCGRHLVDVPRHQQPRRDGQLHRLGRPRGQDRVVAQGAVLGVVGRARDGRRRGLLRHARGLSEGGRLEDREGALQVQNSVRHHRKRDDLHAQGQAVRRRALRHRRLGRHRPCGGPHRTDRRSRRGRRLRGSQQLHRARRPADGIHASAVILPSLSKLIQTKPAHPCAGFLRRRPFCHRGRRHPSSHLGGRLLSSVILRHAFAAAALLLALYPGAATNPAGAEPAKPAREEAGQYFDAEGVPTYNIKPDGTVDWATYSGYRRYHAECHVCHGPDGEGSSYAPALVDSLKTMKHDEFVAITVQGRQGHVAGRPSVMPSFGTNSNVMCYLEDIYVYLRARADGALPRVRLDKREDKPQAAKDAEKTCLGE